MDAESRYDIYERLPDGRQRWRGVVFDLDNLRVMFEVLAESSNNVFFAIHTGQPEPRPSWKH